MFNPQISVIVPVYKVEKYLRKCLDSILEQTYKDIEIICVNDGSPDNCLEILNEYSEKYNSIVIVNQKNAGLSMARNRGLDIAKGKYIAFIDSDDWIEPTYLEKMYNAIISDKNIDIVQCGTKIIFEGKIDQDRKENDERYFAIPDGIINCDSKIFGTINVGSWNKLYKKELIDKYHLRFPKNLRNEDAYYTWVYWSISNKMYCISECLYDYLRRDESLMGQVFQHNWGKHSLDHLIVGKLLYEFLKKNKIYNAKKEAFRRAFVICWWFVRDFNTAKYVKKGEQFVYNFFKNKELPTSEPELMSVILKIKEEKRIKLKNKIQNIFSVKNSEDRRHKVLSILGIKIKFRKASSN